MSLSSVLLFNFFPNVSLPPRKFIETFFFPSLNRNFVLHIQSLDTPSRASNHVDKHTHANHMQHLIQPQHLRLHPRQRHPVKSDHQERCGGPSTRQYYLVLAWCEAGRWFLDFQLFHHTIRHLWSPRLVLRTRLLGKRHGEV